MAIFRDLKSDNYSEVFVLVGTDVECMQKVKGKTILSGDCYSPMLSRRVFTVYISSNIFNEFLNVKRPGRLLHIFPV